MADYLSEYLVKIGFSVDQLGFAKFASAMREATSLVNAEYFSMSKTIAAIGTGVIGGFASIGAAGNISGLPPDVRGET